MIGKLSGPRSINSQYLEYLNQMLYNPLPSSHAMLPYYTRPLAHSIFSMPSTMTRSYPVRDLLPLAGNKYIPMRGDMIPLPTMPGTNFPIHDVVLTSIHYGKDGLYARFQAMGYNPSDIRMVAQYAHIEVVAAKLDELSGAVIKETRQMVHVPYPIDEYNMQTGAEMDGTVSVFVPWRL